MNDVSDYFITHHFLERYVYRFNDNRLENIFKRIEQMKKPTAQQYNRIKKSCGLKSRNNYRVDGDLVVVIVNNVLVTCWRLP